MKFLTRGEDPGNSDNVMADLPLSINLLSYWNEIFDKGGGS